MPYKYNPFTNNFDDSTTGPAGTVSAAGSGTALLPGIAFASDPNTGIYNPSADNLAISTGGTGRIFVDASGNVGIGVSSPATQLEVGGSSAPHIRINNTAGTYSSLYGLEISIGATVDASFKTLGSTAETRISSGRSAGWGGYFTFYTDTTEKLRITSAGLVGIGTTSPSSALHVVGTTSAFGNGAASLFWGDTSAVGALTYSGTTAIIQASSGIAALAFYRGSTENARIDGSGRLLVGLTSGSYQLQLSTDSAGKPSTNTWTIVSDERIKEDIELADLDLCYEAIKTIPLKRYKWRDDVYSEEQVTDRRKLGWIAQDVEAVFPKAVSIHEFKYNQVYETVTVPEVLEELDDEGNVIKKAVPEHTQRGELISEETIPDCKDLNADQIYAAMYGAIQKLIIKFEVFEERLDAAGIK
jgi:hypothetical protein